MDSKILSVDNIFKLILFDHLKCLYSWTLRHFILFFSTELFKIECFNPIIWLIKQLINQLINYNLGDLESCSPSLLRFDDMLVSIEEVWRITAFTWNSSD